MVVRLFNFIFILRISGLAFFISKFPNAGILIDKATYLAANSERRLGFESLGDITVKGKEQVISVYEPFFRGDSVKVCQIYILMCSCVLEFRFGMFIHLLFLFFRYIFLREPSLPLGAKVY
jgi:hypothetical protein